MKTPVHLPATDRTSGFVVPTGRSGLFAAEVSSVQRSAALNPHGRVGTHLRYDPQCGYLGGGAVLQIRDTLPSWGIGL